MPPIYRAYPRAKAVVHAHSDACVAISCQRRTIPPFHYMVAAFGGHDVRCADYAIFGSQTLADAAVAALEGRKACLLANHGMICHGASLEDALASTIKLEMLARQFCFSASFGEPVLLSATEMDEALERYATYGR
jgi:L-fuculose-phosphate aldolase